ncbi:MAG: hypothetical protein JRI68_21515 [Deltaproteobacteria bacterium]|nr:hypothetical protein [Deltaproteobacteria bacterium]
MGRLSFWVTLATATSAAAVFASCGSDFEDGGEGGSSTSTSSGGGSGGSSSSSSSSSGTGGGGGSGGEDCQALGDTCTICEHQACPEIYCACYNNDDCVNLAMCLAMCGTGYSTCAQNCYGQFPSGISIAAQAGHCAATQCQGVCEGFDELPECNLCLFIKCSEHMDQCLANPACAPLLWCTNSCTTNTCIEDCYANHPGGVSLTAQVNLCMQAECQDECAWAIDPP